MIAGSLRCVPRCWRMRRDAGSGEIKKLKIGSLFLGTDRPFIRLPAEDTKSRTEREPALNDFELWAVNHLLDRARLLGFPLRRTLPASGGFVEAHEEVRSTSRSRRESTRRIIGPRGSLPGRI